MSLYAFMLPKDSELTGLFNQKLLIMEQSGVLQRLMMSTGVSQDSVLGQVG